MRYLISSLTALLLVLAGCGKPGVSDEARNRHVFKARGVQYELTWEDFLSMEERPGSFSYEGKRFKISEILGNLTVNGTNYGAVKGGDTVSLLTKGKVLINGTPREPL
jgi:hypothetical protein